MRVWCWLRDSRGGVQHPTRRLARAMPTLSLSADDARARAERALLASGAPQVARAAPRGPRSALQSLRPWLSRLYVRCAATPSASFDA